MVRVLLSLRSRLRMRGRASTRAFHATLSGCRYHGQLLGRRTLPWLRFGTPADTPSFGMASDGTSPTGLALMAGAYGSPSQAAIPVGSGGELGLSDWRPPDSNPFAPNTMSAPARGPDLPPPWFHPQGRDETIPPALNWPWAGGGPADDPSGFPTAPDGTSPTRLALMASAYDSPGQAMTPGDVGNELGLSNWRPPETNPFTQYPMSLPARGSDSQPRLFHPLNTDEEIRSALKSPWLVVEPEDTPPGLRITPAGSNSSAPTGAANGFGLDCDLKALA
jgi:hypothetical protein